MNSTWQTTTKSAAILCLDFKNPRLAQITTAPATESELLAELVSKEDVYAIAKSIVKNGYFPNEFLVAIREGKKIVVAEGNCRLAACKLLMDPSAAPTAFQSKFRTLAATAPVEQLKKIPITIAPSREATFPILLTRHGKPPISAWDLAMQAKFYKQVVEAGWSISDIAAASGQSESKVREDLRVYHLYEMACRLDLPAHVSEIVRNPHKFYLSTLGRVFDRAEARAFFGVQVDENGEVKGDIPESEFIKGFEKLVTDIAKGEKTSRSLNTSSDIDKYLKNFPAANKPDLTKKGNFTASTFCKQAAPQLTAKPMPKTQPAPKTPVGLIPNTVACNMSNQRVKNLFGELRRLSPEKFPNACVVLLRSFLEMSTYCYLDAKGEITAMTKEFEAEIAAYNKKYPEKQPRQVPPHWTPAFDQMIKTMLNKSKNLLPQGHLTKALEKNIHEEEELFGFNLSTHNPTYHPEGKRLRISWARFEEFSKHILK